MKITLINRLLCPLALRLKYDHSNPNALVQMYTHLSIRKFWRILARGKCDVIGPEMHIY